MLGLRATFFIIDVLVKLLTLEVWCCHCAHFHWCEAHHWSCLPHPAKHCVRCACHSFAWLHACFSHSGWSGEKKRRASKLMKLKSAWQKPCIELFVIVVSQ